MEAKNKPNKAQTIGSLGLKPFKALFKSEASGGILLLLTTVLALILANSAWHEAYHGFFEREISLSIGDRVLKMTLHHFINDGLMAVFFFAIGLELKREILAGELSSFKSAMLPVAAAAGGMLFPALFFLAFNKGTDASAGWGIPTATDIAFALGVLALLGKKVPLSLKVFLAALAVADDLGAVLVIAFFYTSDISFYNLMLGAIFLLVLVVGNYMGVRKSWFYFAISIAGLWVAFLLSGVHATIAGVLSAFAIPARTKIDEDTYLKQLRHYTDEFAKADPNKSELITPEQMHIIHQVKQISADAETPLQRLEHMLHPFVTYFVMPVFALANAGIAISSDLMSHLFNPITLGVFLGLLLGKFVGVSLITWLMIRFKLANMPSGASWSQIMGVALLAGIGFTMSLFVTELAFVNATYILAAKLGVFLASFTAGILGFILLNSIHNKKK